MIVYVHKSEAAEKIQSTKRALSNLSDSLVGSVI